MKISPGQLRQVITMIKNAPAVTPRVITVDHIAELQPGDIVIGLIYPETGAVAVQATVLRNEKEAPDDRNLREHNEGEDK